MWTHLEGFEHLSPTELDALLEASVLITVLVGGADGELDREERTWSNRLMQSRTYNKPKHLNDFFTVVANDFLDKIDATMAVLPQDIDQRSAVIEEKLIRLNGILPKLDPLLASDLYKGFVGLAKETAKASGGFLRIGAISVEEARWVKLPMITPIVAPPKNKDEQDEWEEAEKDELES